MKKPVSESMEEQIDDFEDEFDDDGELEVIYVTPGSGGFKTKMTHCR